MKTLVPIMLFVMVVSCGQSDEERIVRYYEKHRDELVQEKELNDFKIKLSYFPSTMLPARDKEKIVEDSNYYHFRMQVEYRKAVTAQKGDIGYLQYGIDTLFTAGDGALQQLPVLVQPIMIGNSNRIEYLLVFERASFGKSKDAVITFYDRLFTNSIIKFRLDRRKMNELES